jgi:DNA-binding transcriptional LysR family regulator
VDLFSLRCFVAVARTGSFSQAARELFRTQPAVSLQVRKLEEELGRPLFDRSRRSPVLTEAGRGLQAGARDLLERLEALPGIALSADAEPAGSLTVASNLSLIAHFLPPPIRSFHRRFPRVRLRMLNRTARGIARAVMEGEADLGVGFLLDDDPDLAGDMLHRSRFVLVSPREGARAGKRRPPLAEILAGPLVHFEEGVDLRRHLERSLPGRRSLEPVIELPSIESILTFVAFGFGCSILPAFAVGDRWRKRLAVRDLGRTIAPLEIRWCADRRRPLSRSAAAFRDVCLAPNRPTDGRLVSPSSSG